MKNIHLVPTDQPSRLYLDSENNFNITNVEMKSGVKKHICITSDETIREGDWVVTNGGLRFVTSINNDKSKTFTDDGSISKKSPSPYCDLEYYKKIILTTDQDLIKDGVQSIDDEFLEWFVKNPTCEEVEVKKEQINNKPGSSYSTITIYKYKIITPQEEPKQHIIDMMKGDAELGLYNDWVNDAEKESNLSDLNDKAYTFWSGYRAGVKSKEKDMIEFAKWVYLEIGSNKGKERTNEELIEQFKKK